MCLRVLHRLLFTNLLLLLLSIGPVIGIYDCPFPKCDTCLPASVHDAPGIGFELNIGYGTSAAHLYNGTVIDLAKVEGDAAYQNLMSRLAHVPLEAVPARDSQWFSRWVNKQLGRSATPDVGILGTFLRRLADTSFAVLEKETGGSLDQYLSKIAITAPLFPALTARDLNDALVYAGMQSWLVGPTISYPELLSPSRMPFAARGRGLCANYRNLYECDDELEEVPAEMAYYVS